jgi:hypothetical protein
MDIENHASQWHTTFKHNANKIKILGYDLDTVIVGASASATIHHRLLP